MKKKKKKRKERGIREDGFYAVHREKMMDFT